MAADLRMDQATALNGLLQDEAFTWVKTSLSPPMICGNLRHLRLILNEP